MHPATLPETAAQIPCRQMMTAGEQIHPMEGEERQAGAVWETWNHLPGKATKGTMREGN